ncbi:MAG: translation initiation factor IF-1 [Oligoflexia bacterium]|nr:MAG: translation initiation factor IF-1 [Oligoflexia bacterium]
MVHGPVFSRRKYPMAKDDLAQIEGKIVDALAGGIYKVQLDNNVEIQAKLCGKMRRFNIRVVVGDRVTVGVSPYDPTHGLIMFRHK